MSLTVGELQVLLSGDTRKLNRDLDQIDNRAGQTEKVHTAAWGRIGAIAGTALKTGLLLATAATVGVGAALRSTVQIGMEYQDQLNTLGAVSGATAQQMAQVAATAKTLGADLTLPATSAADAAAVMTELAKASFTVEEAQTAAKGSLQLAAAAQIDAARAATIQASALQAFSLDASQAGRVSDVLANAANASAAEITDVADALSQASAVAAATGISIEDTAATIGILANNGIKGSDAGTLLKSALLALQSPSDAAAGAMGDLGLTAYDAQGNFVGLSSIFGQLAEAQKRMTPEAYAFATSTLFGSDAARLAGIAGKEGAEGFDAMALAMGRQGAAAEVAAAKAQGVRGAFQGLQSQVETLKIQGFEALSPAMETVIRKASDMVPMLGQRLFSAMEKAIGGAQELREQFGPEMAKLGEVAAQKWGQFVDLLGELGSAVAPSLPDLIDSLVRIAQVGGEVSQAMLPALEAGLSLAGPAADALAGALGIVAETLEAIEPILPIVVTGFLAFKGLSAVAGIFGTMSGALGGVTGRLTSMAQEAAFASYNMDGLAGRSAGRLSTGLSGAATAVGKLGTALPVLGVVIAAAGMSFEANRQKVDAWAQAILDGGAAAAEASRQAQESSEGWFNALTDLMQFGDQESVGEQMVGADDDERFRDATDRANELYAALSPLQRAQQDVTNASNDLAYAQEQHGKMSFEAMSAAERLTAAEERLERKQRDVEDATRSMSEALADQVAQALAAASSDLMLSNARLGVQDATARYNEVLADGAATAADRQRVENDLSQAYYNVAGAALKQAQDQATLRGETLSAEDAARIQIDAMQTMATEMGDNVPASVSTLITSLQGAATQADLVTAAANGVTGAIVAIPGTKDVKVNGLTEEAKEKLRLLDITVTEFPDGSTTLHANTDQAQTDLDNFIATANKRTATVTIFQQIITGKGGYTEAPSGGNPIGLPPVPRRASGGPVWPGQPFFVGEEGQELFVPDVPGTIIDAKKTAAMLAAAGNRQATAMLPGLGSGGGGRSMSLAGGAAGTGSASVGGVTQKHYHLNAAVRQEITPREFVNLQQEADALYG